MPSLPWSRALELGVPAMDRLHRDFVQLLAQARASADEDLRAAWQTLIGHTQEQFAREDEWMRASRFPEAKRHGIQHRVILQVLREGADRAAEGNLASLRLMTRELAIWFPQHIQSLDVPFATHLQRVAFDPATGDRRRLEKAAEGCGCRFPP